MKNKIFIGIIIPFLLISCNARKSDTHSGNKTDTTSYRVDYAEMFTVNRFPEYTEVQVHNPWDTTRLLQTYILVPKSAQLPSPLPEGTLVRTPVSRVAVYSSVHCSMLEQLKSLSEIIGICESRYIIIPEIKSAISEGKIVDLGESYAPDIEKIIELNNLVTKNLKPDLTIVFDIDSNLAQSRLKGEKDRLEKEGLEFHKALRKGYLELAKSNPERIKVISSDDTIENIHKQCVELIKGYIN